MQKNPHTSPSIFHQSYLLTNTVFDLGENFWKRLIQMKEYINLIRNEINGSFAENSHYIFKTPNS